MADEPQNISISPNYQNKLTGVGELFARTWTLYCDRIWTFILISLISSLVFYSLWGIVFAIRPILGIPGALRVSMNMLLLVTMFVIGIWHTAALIVAVRGAQDKLGAWGAYRESWKFLFKFTGVSILMWLVMITGFILLVIPGIYLSVALSFALLIVIAEQNTTSIISSFQKSFGYAKGLWWKIAGRFSFLFLILAGFAVVMAIVIIVPTLAISKALNPKWLVVSKLVTETLKELLIMPLATVYWYLLYEDVKKAKQSVPAAPQI